MALEVGDLVIVKYPWPARQFRGMVRAIHNSGLIIEISREDSVTGELNNLQYHFAEYVSLAEDPFDVWVRKVRAKNIAP